MYEYFIWIIGEKENEKSIKKLFILMSILSAFCFIKNEVNAATSSKSLSWTKGVLTAKEKITINVTLATVNSPKYEYTKSGTNGMYQNVWATYTGISNKTNKTIKGDKGTYTVSATPQWINANKQTITGEKKDAVFVYEGGFQ